MLPDGRQGRYSRWWEWQEEMLGEKKALSGFGTESRSQVNGGGSSGRGTKDRSHRAEESKCYPENTGEVAGEEVGPAWGLMLEKMPFSASQAGRRPPAFRSPGAQVRKPLSGPVGGVLLWASCRGWETTPLTCQAP